MAGCSFPWIKYKVSSDKVIQIEPKQQLKARTGKSPDVAEALMLTHCAADQEAFVVVG
jgi:phage I-like protein